MFGQPRRGFGVPDIDCVAGLVGRCAGGGDPSGSFRSGAGVYGVQDLVGNVWEWTSSKVSVYPGNTTVIPTNQQELITIRGGCYVSDPANPEAPVTGALRQFVAPSTKLTLLGFRLVRSGP